MRIAILTLPLHANYGGILQCYALQTVLERMGHKVEVLITPSFAYPALSICAGIAVWSKRFFETFIIRKYSTFYGWRTNGEIISFHTKIFVQQYIHIRKICDLSILKEQNYEAIVVGSDQIWRPIFYRPIANAYLAFAKDWKQIKRIAYAASFGTDKWEYTLEETRECAALLKLFDAVSVREASAVQLCKNYFQIKAVHLLDPTLLLSKEDYLSLDGVKNTPKHQGELFCYFLDETREKRQWAEILCSKNGWKYFQANNPHIGEYVYENRVQQPLEPWLAGFRDAKFVLTDSFHGCAFSILFNKPFVVIGNQERGMSRFNSLLTLFQLEDRLLLSERIDSIAERPIYWERVNQILNRERNNAFLFLKTLC